MSKAMRSTCNIICYLDNTWSRFKYQMIVVWCKTRKEVMLTMNEKRNEEENTENNWWATHPLPYIPQQYKRIDVGVFPFADCWFAEHLIVAHDER